MTGEELLAEYAAGKREFHGANLHGANLHGANLHGANLHGANLHGANLHGANLHGANLHEANLRGANLHGAQIEGATMPPIGLPGRDLVAWKKAAGGAIVEIGIPADAERTACWRSRKCRAEYAEVLSIVGPDGEPLESAVSLYDGTTTYTVGQDLKPDRWDPDPRKECTHGIHFFCTREEAEAYG